MFSRTNKESKRHTQIDDCLETGNSWANNVRESISLPAAGLSLNLLYLQPYIAIIHQ
jgi:hypothetical protein